MDRSSLLTKWALLSICCDHLRNVQRRDAIIGRIVCHVARQALFGCLLVLGMVLAVTWSIPEEVPILVDLENQTKRSWA